MVSACTSNATMKPKGKARYSNEKIGLPKMAVKGFDSTIGFAKSSPVSENSPSSAEPINVNAKLTKN